MKKPSIALSIALCAIMLFSCVSVAADSSGGKVLTLEEAKSIALENHTQYNLQQGYIEQAGESYQNVYDANEGAAKGSYKSVAARAEANVQRQINIENAALNVKSAVFKKANIERTSNYNVEVAYYNAIKAQYAVDNAKTDMDLKKQDLNIANIKFDQGLLTKNALEQVKTSYASSQTSYNKAFSDLVNTYQSLSKTIGKNLDVFNDKLDLNVPMVDISTVDLNKVKEDFMKNSEDFFSAKNSLDVADYKLDLSQDQYDNYMPKLKGNSQSTTRDDLDDMLNDAQRDYDNAKYTLEQKEKSLDVSLASMYSSLTNIDETIKNLQKNLEDTKTSIAETKLKYDLGLISLSEMNKSEASLKTAENQLSTAIVNLRAQYIGLMEYSDEMITTTASK